MPSYERIKRVSDKSIVTELFFEGRDKPSTQTDPLDPEDMPKDSYFEALGLLKTTAIDILTRGSFNVSSEWIDNFDVIQVAFDYLDSPDLPEDALGLTFKGRLVLAQFAPMKFDFPRLSYQYIQGDKSLGDAIATIQAEASEYLETLRKNPKKQQLSLLDSAA
jgi:hypothetical protein